MCIRDRYLGTAPVSGLGDAFRRAFCWGATLSAVFGLVQYRGGRLSGLAEHPNAVGFYSSVAVAILLPQETDRKFLRAVALAVHVAAIGLSRSRSAYLALALIVLVRVFQAARRRQASVLAVGVVATVAAGTFWVLGSGSPLDRDTCLLYTSPSPRDS